MTALTAAIATRYNVAEAAIIEVREWANVFLAVIKGVGARFVSKKLAPSAKPVAVEWQVEGTLGKAEYKEEYAHFGGKPCYAVYKQLVKKVIGQAPRITWELVRNVDANEFLAKLSSFPAGTKFVY